VAITAGSTYHINWVTDANDPNFTMGDPNNALTQNGSSFRFNTFPGPKQPIATTSGKDDPALAVLYRASIQDPNDPNAYDPTDPNTYVWSEGQPGDPNKGTKAPGFELLDASQVRVPLLAHGQGQFRDWGAAVGLAYGHRWSDGNYQRTVITDTTRGESVKMVSTASPDAYKLYVLANANTGDSLDPNDPNNSHWGGSGYLPNGDLWLELRETDPNDAGDVYGTGKLIGLVVVDKNDVGSSTSLVGGRIVDPNDPNTEIHPSMQAGVRYSLVARGEPNVLDSGGTYDIALRRITDTAGQVNGYLGTDAYHISSNLAAATPSWGSSTKDDYIFRIDLIIPGDATADHAVDVSDLGILAGHYYEHLPEPTTIGLLALGGLSVLIRKRR
jgi:hypothetical protein